jgi:hypothetical protein
MKLYAKVSYDANGYVTAFVTCQAVCIALTAAMYGGM